MKPQYISNIDQSDNGGQIQTEIQPQDDTQLPPDPIALAQHLFKYWEQYLHFHEHMEEPEFHIFAEDTINEQSNLVSESSPYSELQDDGGEEL